METAASRVAAVDVLRGIVLMLLLPDLAGGFAFYRMAEMHPGHWLWQPLANTFTHVPWRGAALWDLVMPLFVFLVGVSMALSQARRAALGDSDSAQLDRAVVRSVALLVLGMLLQFKPLRRVDELLPLLVLSIGLPWEAWLAPVSRRAGMPSPRTLAALYAAAILVFSGGWMAAHHAQLGNYQFGNQILVLLGLAYLPAFLLSRCKPSVQCVAILLLIGGYGLAFMLYDAPAGAAVIGERLTGPMAHWNNGANLGAAFDQWLFALLPRDEPYAGNPHGYHTLQFIPLIAQIVTGALAGRLLAQRADMRRLAARLASWGVAGLAFSAVLAMTWFPLVKSLCTPSWAVFGMSACVLLLAGALRWLDGDEPAGVRRGLVVLGRNSILLYVVAYTEGWRLEAFWQRLVGDRLAVAPWPVLESCLVLLTLWAFAALLSRYRILIRL